MTKQETPRKKSPFSVWVKQHHSHIYGLSSIIGLAIALITFMPGTTSPEMTVNDSRKMVVNDSPVAATHEPVSTPSPTKVQIQIEGLVVLAVDKNGNVDHLSQGTIRKLLDQKKINNSGLALVDLQTLGQISLEQVVRNTHFQPGGKILWIMSSNSSSSNPELEDSITTIHELSASLVSETGEIVESMRVSASGFGFSKNVSEQSAIERASEKLLQEMSF